MAAPALLYGTPEEIAAVAPYVVLPPPGWESSPDFFANLRQKLDEEGVVIIPELFAARASNWRDRLIQWLKDLGTGLTDAPGTWTSESVPDGPRVGMMQSLVGNAPVFWEARLAARPLFAGLLEVPEDRLVTSLDGATVYPCKAPYGGADWPHVDQMKRADKVHDERDGVACFQGQLVLNDSAACFVCSPRSHRIHPYLREVAGRHGPIKDEFFKIGRRHDFDDTVRQRVQEAGGTWQIPMVAPAGSFILWRSTLIHSARRAPKPNRQPGPDPYANWRCVLYICLRDRRSHAAHQLKKLAEHAHKGRTTNHWGTKVFPFVPGGRYGTEKYGQRLLALMRDPERLVDPATLQNPEVRRLVGAE